MEKVGRKAGASARTISTPSSAVGFAGNLLWSLSCLLLSFTLAWILLLPSDFAYPIWYDHAGIGSAIDLYGPQNRFKAGFGDTSRAQRISIFAQIDRAVNRGGKGLENIQYQSASSDGPQQFLRPNEIEHLRDVSRLIDFCKMLSLINVGVCSVLMFLALKVRLFLVRWSTQLQGILALSAGTGLILLAFGAENVFNHLHMWIFPAGHQWFFYYQDSLMSTLMFAPHLFGWIALALVALALPAYVGLNTIVILAQKYLMSRIQISTLQR